MEGRPLEQAAEAENEVKGILGEETKTAPEEAEPICDVIKEETEAPTEAQTPQEEEDPKEADALQEVEVTEEVKPKGERPAVVKKKQPEVVDRAAVDREFVQKAGNPEEYITYQKEDFSGEKLSVYAARRIGLGHIRKQTPCQDFCSYRKIPHGVVLLDADGISACDQGQFGAEFACTVAADAVEKISKNIPDEAEFVRAICTPEFYADLREEWIKQINDHWAGIPHKENDSALFHYGTTLLFVVITENWYVTFNLGDGQIFLFNDDECLKIRLGEKPGQAPSSLIYGTYLEDVQRGVWDRKRFKGVLLTTDGVYDRISCLPWYAGHHYALQAAKRFEEHGEPKSPFIYSGIIDGVERTIDVSRQRSASDDCSIVMALNEEYHPFGHDVVEAIRRHIPQVQAVQLLRCLGSRSSYLVYGPDGYRVIFAVPAELMPCRNPRFKRGAAANVRLWTCEDSWETEGIHYGSYCLPEKVECNFLEGCFQCQQFHSLEQYHKVPDTFDRTTGKPLYIVEPLVGASVMTSWKNLMAVETHLACQNMCLNEMALMWSVQLENEKRELLIPMEALSEVDMPGKKAPWVQSIREMFPGLIGYLTYREKDMPLFAPGAVVKGSTYYLFGTEKNNEELGRFLRVRYNPERKAYGLMNCGQYPWEFVTAQGKQMEIAVGKTVQLTDGCRITVKKGTGREIVCEGHLI